MRFIPKYIYGLLCSAYLFTFGVVRKGNRRLIWMICRHFGWSYGAPRPTLKVVTLSEVIPRPTTVRILHPVSEEGNVGADELVVISQLVSHYALKSAFEIGTFNGRTTLNIAANMKPGGHVATLDLPEGCSSTAHSLARGEEAFTPRNDRPMLFDGTEFASRISRLRGDSALFDVSSYEGTCDLVFVDGSHSLDYVVKDSYTALSLLAPSGGIVIWHDYVEWPEVTAGLNSLCTKGGDFAGLRHLGGTTLVILKTGRFDS